MSELDRYVIHSKLLNPELSGISEASVRLVCSRESVSEVEFKGGENAVESASGHSRES